VEKGLGSRRLAHGMGRKVASRVTAKKKRTTERYILERTWRAAIASGARSRLGATPRPHGARRVLAR